MVIRLTCNTKVCSNYGIGIDFLNPADLCYCGVCGMEITDKVKVLE